MKPTPFVRAQVVELVDTLVSGASAKSMKVQVLSWAPKIRRSEFF